MSSNEQPETQPKADEAAKPATEKKGPTVVKDPRVDTALHVIKGAIVKVLNAPLTGLYSIDFVFHQNEIHASTGVRIIYHYRCSLSSVHLRNQG